MALFSKWVDFGLLAAYKKQFQNLRIPVKFVVPHTPNWDAEYRGIKLGQYISNIRRNLKDNRSYHPNILNQLYEMGFIQNSRHDKHDRILLAFREYKSKFGHCDVLSSFKIAKDDENWHKDVRGLNLGGILERMRTQPTSKKSMKPMHARIHDELTAMGVDLNPKVDFERTFDAFVAFKNIHDHVMVPSKFIVPENDFAFPEHTWGVKLGFDLENIRIRGIFSEHRDRLEALGVDFYVKRKPGFDVIYSALVAYKSVNGHVTVPRKFMIRQGDSAYPEKTWGVKLGYTVNIIRHKGAFAAHTEQLEALGLNINHAKISTKKLQKRLSAIEKEVKSEQ